MSSHKNGLNGNSRERALRKNGASRRNGDSNYVLITGGAGFIGTNVAHRFASEGRQVVLFDDLSRPGVEKNWQWIKENHGDRVRLVEGKIQEFEAVEEVVQGASQIFHFAAQVAVTTSLVDPLLDFEINARGTLNLLEAARRRSKPPVIVFTSTNKVYGDLADVEFRLNGARYEPVDPMCRAHGFNEERPLSFHSPYGCSKGAACQYVLDYARTFGIPAVVFRMSCIYGYHQFGTEDQGWVAHFLIQALSGKPITIYGDGRQVRDILFVEDLVEAFAAVLSHIEEVRGLAFNIGGGPRNTISLLELLQLIQNQMDQKIRVQFEEWRLADQRYYVSDIRKFQGITGWKPSVGVEQGVSRLCQWLVENRSMVIPNSSPRAMARSAAELIS